MKTKKYTHGITFFTDPEMYKSLKEISDGKKLGMSELLREVIVKYLETQKMMEQEALV